MLDTRYSFWLHPSFPLSPVGEGREKGAHASRIEYLELGFFLSMNNEL